MKRFLATFRLTSGEQRAVIFVMVVFLAWTWIKYQRHLNVDATPPTSSATQNEP